jgi:hypothetical protein
MPIYIVYFTIYFDNLMLFIQYGKSFNDVSVLFKP